MQEMITMCDKAAASSVPQSVMPQPLAFIISVMNRIHLLWRYNRLTSQVTASTASMKRFAMGKLLHWATPDVLMIRTVIRTGAKLTLIALRILELAEQKVVTIQAARDLYEAVMVARPLRTRVRLPKGRPPWLQQVVGPDHYVWLVRKKEVLISYVSRVARCTALLFKHMLHTSLCYMSVIEVLSLDPEVENEAISHIFLNSKRLLDEMSENKQHIYVELLRHTGLVQQILSGLSIPCKAEQLINAFATTLTATERTLSAAESIWSRIGGAVGQGISTMCLSISGRTMGIFLPEETNPIGPLAAVGAESWQRQSS